MAVPILLVTGFLGAGKTTLVNRMLTEPDGRRLAAVVNDFGAVDIDAALLASVNGDVVSLKNGCICCSLQGDLLQTLSALLRRNPAPDAIVIETSGVSDPAEIVRSLLDPVIWREAALDTVICLADARHLADTPPLLDEPLCRSQILAADFVALTKTDLVDADELRRVRLRLGDMTPDSRLQEARHGFLPPELLFSGSLRVSTAPPARSCLTTPGFQSVSWTCSQPLSLQRFQAEVARFAGRLLRAKGIVLFADHPDRPMLFQMVGTRATISPAPNVDVSEPVQLVFIARDGMLDREDVVARLEACVDGCTS